MTDHNPPTPEVKPELNELLRNLGAQLQSGDAPIRSATPPNRQQINRTIKADWWRDGALWQELFRNGVKIAVFTISFSFCGFIGREVTRYGVVAHVLGGLLNPIPLALAISTLGMVALVRRQFDLMTLAQQLLVAHLIATQIV